jgi:hypothetical protein
MKINTNNLDRAIRVLIAIVCFGLYYYKAVPSAAGIVLLVVAIIMLLTAFVGFCPIYKLLGISTKKEGSSAH